MKRPKDSQFFIQQQAWKFTPSKSPDIKAGKILVEAATVLRIIASGHDEDTEVLINHGAHDAVVQLLNTLAEKYENHTSNHVSLLGTGRRVDFYIRGPRSVSEFHSEYNVTIDGVQMVSTVTQNKLAVAAWIRNTYNYHTNFNNGGNEELIVGFDAKVHRPWDRRWAIIQLFVGRRCLVYQISRVGRSAIPLALVNFFRDENIVFVGIDALPNLSKLSRDYGIGGLSRCMELGRAAADAYGRRALREAGLREIAVLVMRRDFILDEWPWVSNHWDVPRLTLIQVLYATFHAYLSYEIGRSLFISSPISPRIRSVSCFTA